MAEKLIRVGVIGIGGIGGVHARAAMKHPGMSFEAFLDAVPAIRERAAGEFTAAKACATLEEFLAVPLDAAIVATPNNTHAEYTIACAKAGLHVLCEKPLAMSVKEAEAMCAAIKKAKRVGLTHFSYRWINCIRALRRLVRNGEFGAVNRLHIKYLQSHLMDKNLPIRWRDRIDIAGFGALGDLGSHMIDTARFITGAEPQRVIGVTNIHATDKPDPETGKRVKVTTDTDAQFMIDFGSFVGIFETSQVEPAHGNHHAVSIGGEKGSARATVEERDALEIAVGAPYADSVTWQTCLPKIVVPTLQRFTPEPPQAALYTFFDAIRKKTKDYPSFEDGLAAQKVLAAICKSEKSGRWEKA